MSSDFSISSISTGYPEQFQRRNALQGNLGSGVSLPTSHLSFEGDITSFSRIPEQRPTENFVQENHMRDYNPSANYQQAAMAFPYMNAFISPERFFNATMYDIANFVDMSQMMVSMGAAMNPGFSLAGQFGNYLQMMNTGISQPFAPMMPGGTQPQNPGLNQMNQQNNPLIIDNTGPLDPRATQIASRLNTSIQQAGYQGLKDFFTFGNARSTIKQYITSLSPYMLTEVERAYDTNYGEPGTLRVDIENSTIGRTQTEIKKHLDYALAYNNNYSYVAQILNKEFKGLDWDNSGQKTVERYISAASPYSLLKTQTAYDGLTGNMPGQFRKDIEKDTMFRTEKRLIGKLNEAELFMIGLSQQGQMGQGYIPTQPGQISNGPMNTAMPPMMGPGMTADTMSGYIGRQDPLLPYFGDQANNIRPTRPLQQGDLFDPSLDPSLQIK